MSSYKLLCRVLKEQCEVSDNREVLLKAFRDIPSDSLQNPSDPDAGYSGHKGQGYQAQIMETYSDTDDVEKKNVTLNLISYVEVESADKSDAKAVIPAIKTVEKRGLKPKELLVDSLYGSDKNCLKAKAKGVELVSPVKNGGKGGRNRLDDFKLSDSGEITDCPCGNKPILQKKKKRYSVAFACETCSNCPDVGVCIAVKGKKYYYVRYVDKDLRLAKRRINEKSDEFKERYRWRSGSEATMSECDRRTGIKHLRVRGFTAVRAAIFLRVIAVNIIRANRARKAGMGRNIAGTSAYFLFFEFFLILKELFENYFWQTRKISD
jgi:transposase